VGSERPDVSALDGATALYLFKEDAGNTVHNQVDSTTGLVIPERFFVLHEPFLERPWNEYHPGWNYWKDIGVNIGGFIPFGFLFYAYFLLVHRIEHPAAVTVACGFAVSLTIEVLQAFLPTRNSGMTDLITNSIGTAIGVIVFRHKALQLAFAKADIDSGSQNSLDPGMRS
jgi:VanZ family protein